MRKWEIIHEDDSLIVVHKMAGIATESARIGSPDLVSELRKYLKRQAIDFLGVIHRLDQPVEGILVFAKTKEAAANLSSQVSYDVNSDKTMIKSYKALVYGHMQADEGILTDYLIKDAKTNLSYIAKEGSKNAKKAILEYKVLEKDEHTELIAVELKTGRHHQIRVQFAGHGCPLVGDLKYGTESSQKYSEENAYRNVNLIAYKLEFMHPKTKETMVFEI